MKMTLARRVSAEFLGTAFLVAAVVGSGIMAERLSGGNVALALLANTIATGAALVALILAFGPVSGAHLNPVVTLMDALEKGLPWGQTPHYMVGQILGGVCGTVTAHLMFGLSLVSYSNHVRHGPAQVFSEFVATFGLVSVIWGCSRLRSNAVPFAVGAYITAAYWFTASTPLRILRSPLRDASATPSQASVLSMCLGLYSLSSSAVLRPRWCFAGSFLPYKCKPKKSFSHTIPSRVSSAPVGLSNRTVLVAAFLELGFWNIFGTARMTGNEEVIAA